MQKINYFKEIAMEYPYPYMHASHVQYYPPIHYPPPPQSVEGAWGSAVAHGPPPPDIFKLGISPFYFETISQKSGHPVHYLPAALVEKLPLIVIAEALAYDDWDTMYRVFRAFDINVNTPLSGSLTLIWYASRDGKFNIVQNLLLMGANPNVFDVATHEGPLDMAVRKHYSRLEHLLRAYKANKYPKKIVMPAVATTE